MLSIAHQLGNTVINSQVLTYDAQGNRTGNQSNISQPFITTAAASTFDAENRLLTRPGTTYTYDDNGNRLTETSAGGTTTYNWDTRNRLTSITTAQGQTFAFKYDFRGLMIAKDVTGSGPKNSETYLLDDRTNVVWQTANGQTSSILSGRRIDHHIAVSTGSSTTFGLTDAVNSTVALTDRSGIQNGKYTYEPFGQISSQSGQFPFQFTGRPTVGVGGLYYYRARFYDSLAGRFLSQDPLGLTGSGVNLFAYAGNAPESHRDPAGLATSGTAQDFLGTYSPIPNVPDGEFNLATFAGYSSQIYLGVVTIQPELVTYGAFGATVEVVDGIVEIIDGITSLPPYQRGTPPPGQPYAEPCPTPTPAPTDQCIVQPAPTPKPTPTPFPVACPTPTFSPR